MWLLSPVALGSLSDSLGELTKQRRVGSANQHEGTVKQVHALYRLHLE
jgi:hypothetical protein